MCIYMYVCVYTYGCVCYVYIPGLTLPDPQLFQTDENKT